MATEELQITFPVGRLVQGSLYKGDSTDQQGNPKVIKNGPNAGKPRTDWYFALAIPKNPGEQSWAQTAWGAQIYALAQRAWPQGQFQSPLFSWKIIDGDSTLPDQGNPPRAPNTREGFPGHWIVKFSRPVAPNIYRMNNGQPVPFPEVDAIKLGDYVEVFGVIKSNENPQKAGLYVNHSMVCFAGYGARIVTGPDVSAAGFGRAALPPGASATPPAGFAPPAAPAAALPGAGYAPAGGAMPPFGTSPVAPAAQLPAMPGVAPAPVAAQLPPPVAVQPYPGILTPPGAAPMAPPVADPLIEGVPLSQWRANGWTDELLRAHGKM